jgi:hypothetical protein
MLAQGYATALRLPSGRRAILEGVPWYLIVAGVLAAWVGISLLVALLFVLMSDDEPSLRRERPER